MRPSNKPYKLADLLAQCDPSAPVSSDVAEWDNMPAVGDEWGSPDSQTVQITSSCTESVALDTFSALSAEGMQRFENDPVFRAQVKAKSF